MADFLILNKMEAMVKIAIDDLMAKGEGLKVCDCPRCRLDILALALNSLPPRYVVTEFGEIMTRFDLESSQWKTDVMIAVVNALEVVKKKPRHQK